MLRYQIYIFHKCVLTKGVYISLLISYLEYLSDSLAVLQKCPYFSFKFPENCYNFTLTYPIFPSYFLPINIKRIIFNKYYKNVWLNTTINVVIFCWHSKPNISIVVTAIVGLQMIYTNKQKNAPADCMVTFKKRFASLNFLAISTTIEVICYIFI